MCSLQLDCSVGVPFGFPTKAALTKVNMPSKLIWKQLDQTTSTAFPERMTKSHRRRRVCLFSALWEWLQQPRPKSANAEGISTVADKEVLWDLVQFTRSLQNPGNFCQEHHLQKRVFVSASKPLEVLLFYFDLVSLSLDTLSCIDYLRCSIGLQETRLLLAYPLTQ